MTATNSPWGWLDNNEPTPAAVVPLPQRPRSVPTVAVIGAAGGAGVSVLSVLVADARARAGQSVLWLDAAATPGDVAARIASPDAASEYSAGGALLRYGAELPRDHRRDPRTGRASEAPPLPRG